MDNYNKETVGVGPRSLKETMATDDRPRERAKAIGFNNLSIAELLAIIVGSGSQGESVVELCRRILHDNDDKLYKVARLSIKQLMKYKGVGEVKAIEMLAALELARRYQSEQFDQDFQILSSINAYNYLKAHMSDNDHEEIWVLMLNRSKRVTQCVRHSIGGTTAAIADIKILLRSAIEHLAEGIILAHNHPSDNPSPSQKDDDLTQRVKQACNAVDIEFVDHIIVCRGGRYYSYNDNGRL